MKSLPVACSLQLASVICKEFPKILTSLRAYLKEIKTKQELNLSAYFVIKFIMQPLIGINSMGLV